MRSLRLISYLNRAKLFDKNKTIKTYESRSDFINKDLNTQLFLFTYFRVYFNQNISRNN